MTSERISSEEGLPMFPVGKVLNADCYVLNAEAVWEKALKKYREDPLYFVEKSDG